MINFKTVFAIALLSASTATVADEILIDTDELYQDINIELAQGIEQLQQELSQDIDVILVAKEAKLNQANVQVTR
ncbi:hypothetical protein LZP69_08100 [Shewanella sp. AS1]|uniref:hypothetical protein n=1 Tax=Shewanella sp. AS1 TaxID=2907626 RepID=UPI001F35C1D5|nr:hypothetical protein [Shewanella sp. AS1]MCE9679140.1 hypothetical protein [Shewanella sp. AS1]